MKNIQSYLSVPCNVSIQVKKQINIACQQVINDVAFLSENYNWVSFKPNHTNHFTTISRFFIPRSNQSKFQKDLTSNLQHNLDIPSSLKVSKYSTHKVLNNILSSKVLRFRLQSKLTLAGSRDVYKKLFLTIGIQFDENSLAFFNDLLRIEKSLVDKYNNLPQKAVPVKSPYHLHTSFKIGLFKGRGPYNQIRNYQHFQQLNEQIQSIDITSFLKHELEVDIDHIEYISSSEDGLITQKIQLPL